MNYKETINLPRTDFSMKANLPKLEPEILKVWKQKGIYNLIREKSRGKKKYILHDGPPYANGDIHIGHALNKILKDIVVKYKTMKGFDSPFVPGWDCHGLPVEHQLFKELGITKDEIEKTEFRKKAFDYAMRFVNIQKEEFERLGVFGDWQNPYLTLDKGYEAKIIEAFGKLAEKGYVYKGLKPIHWCTWCETALAEAEVEYEQLKSPSIYVKFKTRFAMHGEAYFVIWTTTPWTLPSNVAIAVHPEIEYALVKTDLPGRDSKEILVVAIHLVDTLLQKLGGKGEILAKIPGKYLEGVFAEHPFIEKPSRVILADYVSGIEGTGCVHIAPGHGEEDYKSGLKYKLPVIMPVGPDGRFSLEVKEFCSMYVFDSNPAIINRLRENDRLLFSEEVEHTYPHCWRCKRPVIFRATEQWFINVENDNLREKTLALIKKVEWIPKPGENRISSMVENRPDWCLSRQRYWGVPIPVFYCMDCRHELLDSAIIRAIKEAVLKEGSDVWFSKTALEFLPEGIKCKKCGGSMFAKETDIIDVWFDSGVSHYAVLETREDLSFPADLYLEGSDQHRGWFQASILTSIGLSGNAPFNTVLTHGFVVDSEGRKMSKSEGNVISPQDVIKDYGSDILRLWVASSDYHGDVRISNEILSRLSEAYRKIRNTYRFLLGNIYDFDPDKDRVKYENLLEIDKWALSKAHSLLKEIDSSYEKFDFYRVYHMLYNFCTIEMSSFYLDILKDRLYTFGKNGVERRSAQTVLYEILVILVKAMAPIMVFTTEEVWGYLHPDMGESIHLTDWPQEREESSEVTHELEDMWEVLIDFRNVAIKELEVKRAEKLIGNSLEVKVIIYHSKSCNISLLKRYAELLPGILIVSQVELIGLDESGYTELPMSEWTASGSHSDLKVKLEVKKAEGKKCERCWNWSESVGMDSKHPQICKRCVKVVT